ncbi:uncharacterized protein LOC111372148 [Olea europaea subsp. europaea]|uniref:Uncharacterized protein LOC111372148 n=1 Tax=Olea europaea subsp. europaea TaxID=158383 RepID=A0A8S0TYQ8_OLEEU|nr:uncharacterized protein LOC111372148 [Olea europaea subsp. europaea]
MVKKIVIFACLLIIALDITAGILGIKAEAAQNQEKHLRLWIFECKEPSHDAFVLGVAAATLLFKRSFQKHLLASNCQWQALCLPGSYWLLAWGCW